MKMKLITASVVLMLLVPFLFGGCSGNAKTEGFAIYLTKYDVSPDKMEMLSHADLADKPLISGDDIIAYYQDTHEIQLTSEAYQRIDAIKVPTTGVSFMVCVDRSPVYRGAFWTPISSQSFDGITIWVKPSLAGENRIQISLGYPTTDFHKGGDPRSSPIIIDALKAAGKLK
jgi:hypothetical protein